MPVKDAYDGLPTGAVSLSYSLTPTRLTYIALGFFGCFFIQYASQFYVRKFHPKFYASLDKQTAVEVGVRITSSCWGAMCGWWALPLCLEAVTRGANASQRIYATPPIASLEELKCMAVGFFAWDTIVSSRYYDAQYVAHAVVSVITFLLPQFMPRSGFLHCYAAFFLLWEVTLPFLSLRFMMIKSGRGHTKAFQVVNFTGFGIWFVVRFLTGLPVMGMVYYDFYELFKRGLANPIGVYAWYLISCIILQIFNIIWLSAIIKALFGKSKEKYKNRTE